jgi:hypothetical protein
MGLVYDVNAIEAVSRPDLGLFTVRFALNVSAQLQRNRHPLWIDARLQYRPLLIIILSYCIRLKKKV